MIDASETQTLTGGVLHVESGLRLRKMSQGESGKTQRAAVLVWFVNRPLSTSRK